MDENQNTSSRTDRKAPSLRAQSGHTSKIELPGEDSSHGAAGFVSDSETANSSVYDGETLTSDTSGSETQTQNEYRSSQTPARKRNTKTSGNRAVSSDRIRRKNKFRALLFAIAALIVIVLVGMIAAGAFDNAELKAEKQARKESVSKQEERKTEESSEEAETTAAPETTTEELTVNADARTVYFTFNGCAADVTDDILDVLDKNGVKATFFVTADESNASVLKKIAEQGHALGVYVAPEEADNTYQDIESFKNDVNTCRQFIFQQTGVMSDIYRFSGGSIQANDQISLGECKAYLKELGMVYYDWNIESGDDMDLTVDAQTIADSILGNLGAVEFKTNVVLLHNDADKTTTADALDAVIPALKEGGYEFAKLSSKTPEMTFDIE